MADSDLINALQTSNRSASVLQGIANPPQINPLAAITAGNQAAQQAFQTDQAQMQTGAMRSAMIASQAMTVARDGSDANLAASFANLRASGAFPPQLVDQEYARWKAMSEKERQDNAVRIGILHLDQLHQVIGQTTLQTFGGTTAPVTTFQPTASSPGGAVVGGGIAHTVSPETYFTPQSAPILLDANDQPTNDPSKAVRSVPRDVARGPAMGAPAPGSVSGPQFPPKPPFIPSDATSGAPGLPPGAPPPPPGQRLVGGKFVTPPAVTPPPANAATPSPTPPPASAAPAQPPAAAPSPSSAPAGGGVVTGLPTGTAQTTEDSLRKDVEARTVANTAMGEQQKRLIAGQSALDALKLADTGPSTGFFARAYAFLKAQGITTVERGQLSDTDYRQLLQKNLLRFAQDNGSKAGTDLGLETKLHSNANADEMLAGANRHVLIQDMGILKRDITQTQEMPEPSPTGAVVKHIGSFPANTAPEAFMWNHYTQPERDAIEKEYKDKGQTERLHDSLALAVKRGAIPDPRKAAPPPPPAAVVPRPAPNALMPPAAPP
jgi:hypothetical protein